jgi:hypothetical protein
MHCQKGGIILQGRSHLILPTLPLNLFYVHTHFIALSILLRFTEVALNTKKSINRFTASDYPFGILKHFFALSYIRQYITIVHYMMYIKMVPVVFMRTFLNSILKIIINSQREKHIHFSHQNNY